nr:MAG TPA: hypothetical protein [Caudoviricetes sp.]DAW87110.1 MAG TPA: hypothetical protein [Bacteriophage sp.]DAX73012.1 MAG TPA: hypothetical protein [Caudoviricetes sp.]
MSDYILIGAVAHFLYKICSCALNNRKTRLVRPAITKA